MAYSTVAWVAFGGAIGAVARYSVMSAVSNFFPMAFPLGTIIVNVAGSFILGVLIEVFALVWSPGPEVRALLVVGVLGAFTTFSTFSLDVVYMLQRGQMASALVYVAVSVVLSIIALWVGMIAGRYVF